MRKPLIGYENLARQVETAAPGSICASIAQLVELRYCKLKVLGSSPSVGCKGDLWEQVDRRIAAEIGEEKKTVDVGSMFGGME